MATTFPPTCCRKQTPIRLYAHATFSSTTLVRAVCPLGERVFFTRSLDVAAFMHNCFDCFYFCCMCHCFLFEDKTMHMHIDGISYPSNASESEGPFSKLFASVCIQSRDKEVFVFTVYLRENSALVDIVITILHSAQKYTISTVATQWTHESFCYHWHTKFDVSHLRYMVYGLPKQCLRVRDHLHQCDVSVQTRANLS